FRTRLELAEHLAPAHLARTELGDRVVHGPAGRLEVDDAEGDQRQVSAEVVERRLRRWGCSVQNRTTRFGQFSAPKRVRRVVVSRGSDPPGCPAGRGASTAGG